MTSLARALVAITLLGTGVVALAGAAAEADTDVSAVFDTGRNAFGRALANLQPERFPRMLEGKLVFVHRFQGAGSGPEGLDGLGPLYVADSCSACHFKDGRGRRPKDRPAPYPPMIFRLGGHPTSSLGGQLQDQGLGVEPEGRVQVVYQEEPGRYRDGTSYSLRRPSYRLFTSTPRDPADQPALSPRIPPTLIGMGLLEAVAPSEVLALADPDDADGDGISGRASWIRAPRGDRLGRFGWKAEQATLDGQVTAALAEDMGIAAASEPPEIAPVHLARLVLYLRLLAPPARRLTDRPEVLRGEQVFSGAGCAGCHRPRLRTGAADAIAGPPELASQWIRPYTDLLLHDMGPELADGSPADSPESREWRTPPLWGLGLLDVVNGEAYFLHDGRARTFAEAILWHGGEARTSRRRFEALSASDREALLLFLASL